MKKILTLIIVLFLAEIATAQDPGIPDTVRFGKWGVYLPCPPCSGVATIPIYVFNDEYLFTMQFYFECAGPVKFRDIEFSAGVDSYLNDIQSKYLPAPDSDFMSFSARDFTESLPPGLRNIGFLVLSIYDSGMALVDTASPEAPPDPPIWFETSNVTVFKPTVIMMGQAHLQEQSIQPGDNNANNKVDLGDIVYFVNYLFRNGSEPVNNQMADVNVDCVLNLADLVYVVNYIFRGGPGPLPGCAWV